MITYDKPVVATTKNNGYLCFFDKEHPLATEACQYRVFLHRHIASIKYGHWLNSDEHVHHIDENILNNSPDNLIVVTAKEHAELHRKYPTRTCLVCSTEFYRSDATSKYCSPKCNSISQIRNKDITSEILQKELWYFPYTYLATKYVLSDMGIKKRAKAMGLLLPPARFHVKSESEKQRLRLENNILPL